MNLFDTHTPTTNGGALTGLQTSDKLLSLFTQAPAGIALLEGPQHRYTFANPLYQKIFNRTEKQLLGRSPKEVFPEVEGQGIFELLDQVYHNREPFTAAEFPATFQDEEGVRTGYFNFVIQPVQNDAGEATGLMVHLNEVSKQVEAHKKTAESEAKYQSLFNSIDNGFCTIEVLFDEEDKPYNYRFIEVNKAFEQQTGLTNAVGFTMNDFTQLENSWYEKYGKVAVTGEAVRFESRAENLHRFYDVYAFKTGGAEERKVAVLFTDITERKRAEQKLQETSGLLQTVFDSSPNSITVMQPLFDEEGNLYDFTMLLMNAYTLKIVGNIDYKGKRYSDLFPTVKETGILDQFKEVVKTGSAAKFERWYVGEGMKHWFRFTAVKHGDLLVVTTEDITESKQAEETIEANEDRLSNIISQINAGIAQTTTQGTFTDVNERFCQLTGYTKEELRKKTIQHITHPDDWPRNKELFIKALIEGKNFFIEKRYVRKDGSFVWVNNSVSVVTDPKGEKFVTAVSVDITEQITSRQKLEESEERFRSMADASPVMIWTLDEGGNSTYYNSRAAEFTGHTETDIRDGKSWQVAIHPEDIEAAGAVVGHAVANRVPYQMECRMQRADGEWRWLLNHGTPRFGKGGEYFGFVGSSIDITEQKKSQQELQTALEQMRLSKEAAELGTFDLDMEKGTLHWDKRCRTLFGIKHNNPVSYDKDFIGSLHPDDRDRILKAIDRTHNKTISNHEFDEEYRTIGAEDGVERWVRAKGKLYFSSDERPVRFIGSVLDITEKVTAIQLIQAVVEERTKELAQANESLQRINKELQRSNQNLEEFAHAASHDLKEPVRKIHFFTHQLKEQLNNHLKEGELRLFNRIENASERMGHLIDDLLLYSHASQRPHEKEAVDLTQQVQNALEDLELDVAEKKAIIHIEKLPVVKGYRRQLQQVFQNLISNALKYSRAGVPPRIDMAATEVTEDGKLYHLITVRDNGIGFGEEYADKIFQMFTRLHGRTEYSGTGVGLAIVKKVVENHHGFITAESEVGVGSVFKIYLPE